jgi:hypothetical protein
MVPTRSALCGRDARDEPDHRAGAGKFRSAAAA